MTNEFIDAIRYSFVHYSQCNRTNLVLHYGSEVSLLGKAYSERTDLVVWLLTVKNCNDEQLVTHFASDP